MTNRFIYPNYPMDIALCLEYLVSLFGDNTYIPYTFTGDISANTEVAWNAVVWTDMRTQPTWSDLLNAIFNANDRLAYIASDTYEVDMVTQVYTTIPAALATKANTSDLSTAIAALVNSAPGTLDTLGEIATALSADESAAAALATTVGNKVDKISGKGLSTNDYTTAEKNKLANAVTAYFGTTLVTNPIIYTKSIAISSGTAVFQLTTDGTSTGTAVFPNGPNMDSIQAFVNDAMASYQMGYALTNSNKTLTITCNKLSTANILTGVLSQVAAPNGTSIKLTIMGS